MKTQATPKTATAKKAAAPGKKTPASKSVQDAAATAKTEAAGSKNTPGQKAPVKPVTDEKRAAAAFLPQPEEIAARAYKIWQQQGCPDGCEEQHWRQAEQEISRDGSSVLIP